MYYAWCLALLLIFNTTVSLAQSQQPVSTPTSTQVYVQTVASAANAPAIKDKLVAGYIEKAAVSICGQTHPIEVDAKLDTGADSTSFHATDIFIDKKKKTVTFTSIDGNGDSQRITCQYIRTVRVKKRPSGYDERPVIKAQIHIASKVFDAEINLTDRTHFSYKLLVGRKDLRKGFLIDSSQKYRLGKPDSP
ncbi:ATP-dependent zinc protease family protein [Halodesulfovibrio marinisediminis]|uniref:Uncharacterized conserved protein n=1 Tax=Halodesulfovibrio marinisediminis DSM 17456 TaxID=1121457 RepID=A0A1N6I7P8_9BACT|nr:RimK/LysX family protein [Halodesulfovibrio marinisediminis]SIO28033.1 Uncharacterized conserved protein [Halodesulfovibrio marinisediminis DSM 17456]